MPLLYKTIQSTKANKEGHKLYHPRAVHTGTVSTNQIAKEIAEYSSLSTGDVKNTIDNLVTVMTKHLQSSETVSVDGMGTFSLVMRSRGNGALTADEVRPSQAMLLVRFTPAFTKNQDNTTATRALITGVKCAPYDKDAALPDEDTDEDGGGNDDGDGGDGDQGETPLG